MFISHLAEARIFCGQKSRLSFRILFSGANEKQWLKSVINIRFFLHGYSTMIYNEIFTKYCDDTCEVQFYLSISIKYLHSLNYVLFL